MMSMKRALRILLIEDSLSVQKAILSILATDPKMTIDTVENLRLALEKLSAYQYDVIVLDLQLPDANDLVSLKSLRASHPQIAIVVLTGYGTPEVETEAMELGAQDFLEKPPEPARLINVIHKAAIRQEVMDEVIRKFQPIKEAQRVIGEAINKFEMVKKEPFEETP